MGSSLLDSGLDCCRCGPASAANRCGANGLGAVCGTPPAPSTSVAETRHLRVPRKDLVQRVLGPLSDITDGQCVGVETLAQPRGSSPWVALGLLFEHPCGLASLSRRGAPHAMMG